MTSNRPTDIAGRRTVLGMEFVCVAAGQWVAHRDGEDIPMALGTDDDGANAWIVGGEEFTSWSEAARAIATDDI